DPARERQIMLRNFLYRVSEYFHANRRLIVKSLLIAAAILIAFLLIRASVERWQRSRYEKHVQALETQIREAEGKAKEAEARAAAAALAIKAKQAELRDLQARAEAAEIALRTTRTIVVPLKEKYEQARNTPVVTADVSCAAVCAELAVLGHPC